MADMTAHDAFLADPDVFLVWGRDDIDSSFYEDTEEPRPLYVALLCVDAEGKADLVRGYDPRDGIFERPGMIVESLWGIDLDPSGEYKRVVEAELYAQFQARREAVLIRGEN